MKRIKIGDIMDPYFKSDMDEENLIMIPLTRAREELSINPIEDYTYDIQKLITIVKKVFPEYSSKFWDRIQFRRDCSKEKLEILKEGLSSKDINERIRALYSFMDTEKFYAEQMAILLGVTNRVIKDSDEKQENINAKFKNLNQTEFIENLKTAFFSALYEEYIELIKRRLISLEMIDLADSVEKSIREQFENSEYTLGDNTKINL